MKSFFNETNIKIGLIGLMIVGMIFLGKYQKANSEFNISDMSIVNSIEKVQAQILETPKNEVQILNNSTDKIAELDNSSISSEEKKIEKAQSQSEIKETPLINDVVQESIPEEKITENAQEQPIKPIDSTEVYDQIQIPSISHSLPNENDTSEKADSNNSQTKESKADTNKAKETNNNQNEFKSEEKINNPVLNNKAEKEEIANESENKINEKKNEKEINTENKENEDKKLLPIIEENKTEQKENITVANEPKLKSEEKFVNNNFTNFNLIVVILAIMMNLIVYYYVYRHLSMNISKNLDSLKSQLVELEESFSYRSIADI